MGTQITPTGIKFDGHDDEQTAPVRSVNGNVPDSAGNVTIEAGGGSVNKVNGNSPDSNGNVTVSIPDHSGDITNLQNQINTNTNNVNALGPIIVGIQNDMPSDVSDLSDNSGLLSSGGGGGRVLIFNSSDTYNKPAGVVGLEILMVAGGSGGGNTPYQNYWVYPTQGGNTTITGLPDGDLIAHGGGSIETVQANIATSQFGVGKFGYTKLANSGHFGYGSTVSTPLSMFGVGGGEGGYGGKDGGVSLFVNTTSQEWSVGQATVSEGKGGSGGGGVRTPGSAVSPPNKSLSGGQGSTSTTYSGDASDWNISAPLGGTGEGDNSTYRVKGGDGKFSGGGGGHRTTPGGGGGGGIGAGGGAVGAMIQSYGGAFNSTLGVSYVNTGGLAGESINCTISVPSAAASYQIQVGAGGDGGYSWQYSGRPDLNPSAGGGGQGIVIIKEISDLTISTP